MSDAQKSSNCSSLGTTHISAIILYVLLAVNLIINAVFTPSKMSSMTKAIETIFI